VRKSPTNWHTPQFGFLARDAETRTGLAAALVRSSSIAVDISFLDREDAALGALIAAARDRRTRVLVRTLQRSPYVDLTAGDWDAFRATLDAQVHKELRRTRRRLEERGRVGVEFFPGARRLAEGLRLEGSGWKDHRGSAIASESHTERFYREIAAWAEAQGELVLAFLRVGGRPIAFDLCLESAGRVYVLKGGFDPAFRRYGPGMLLTHESIRRAFERGRASYELLGDADRYKLVWTRTVRERMRVQVFNVDSVAGGLSWAAWAYGRPAARRIRAAARRSS
jgi:CelD/BcsL family acetyltransferase involved in cellulose biosynthesis